MLNLLNKKRTFICHYLNETHKDLNKVEYGSKGKHNDLSSIGEKDGTVMKCPGFMLSKPLGFIVYFPFSFQVTLSSTGTVVIDSEGSGLVGEVEIHPNWQKQGFYKNYIAVKVTHGLMIKEKTGITCTYMAPFTENMKLTNDTFIPSGVIDFKYNNGTNIFVMVRIPKEGEKTYKFNAGDPALKIIPHCERWELEHVVDPNFQPINHWIGNVKSNRYAKARKLLKQKEERNA